MNAYDKLFFKKEFNNSKLKFILNPRRKAIDIFFDQGLVGYVRMHKDPYVKKSIEISYLYIFPEFRKQGLGTMFMEIICKYADKKKYQIILIPYKICSTPKTKLIRFYKKFNFEMINKLEMIRKSL